ncbi:MAG: DNA sulfur modification protein DndB [Bacillota bacterium]|nr:DNA sulfur modification protein DndB [Bacillota bacterium]
MAFITYNFSAIRGKQWGKDFYSFMCPLNIVSRLFNDAEENIPNIISDKIDLNKKLVEKLTIKILDNKETYFVEPILAAIDTPIQFKALDDQYPEIGVISFPMISARLIINGLEEKVAIEKAIKKNPKMRNSVLSVVIYHDPGFVMAEELLKTKKIKKYNKNDNIAIDKVEDYANQLIENHDFIKKRIDLNNKSLGKYSKKLYLKKQIAQTTRAILGEKSIDSMHEIVDMFWIDYFTQIKLIKQFDGYQLRTDYVIDYGTVLEAMALSVKELYADDEYDREKFFIVINEMDWSRKNRNWKKNILTDSGRVIKNSDAVTYVMNKVINEYKKTPV